MASDARRALPLHEVGVVNPTSRRSRPVVIQRAPGTVQVPAPPSSGTKVLRSVDGVLSWVDPA